MPIDDPISAIQRQVEGELREASPVTDYVLGFAAEIFPSVGKLRDILQRHREEHQRLFMETVFGELKRLWSKSDALTEEHRKFLCGDFLGLLIDGIKKAEDVRAKERIVRLAKIVTGTAQRWPEVDLNDSEELMRVAMNITDKEAEFLRQMTLMPSSNHQGGIATIEEANDDWKEHYPKISGVNLSEYQSPRSLVQT